MCEADESWYIMYMHMYNMYMYVYMVMYICFDVIKYGMFCIVFYTRIHNTIIIMVWVSSN